MDTRVLPKPSELARHWALDPGVVFLNHGSFGACPRAVQEAQQRIRERMEFEPVRFFLEELEGLLDGARRAVAGMVGCRAEDLAFLPNATAAVATVVENLCLGLGAGDEILINSHEYPACQNGIRYAAKRYGLTVVNAPIPWPLSSPDQVVDAVLSKVTGRTRVALLSHVTSPSAIVLPLERIVPGLARRGVSVVIDGAHGIGFHPIDLGALAAMGVSFYTSNCHKWLCAPKGSAFLWVREDRQKEFRPLVLSNRAESPRANRAHFLTEFDFQGTNDPSAYLAVPAAIEAVGGMVPGAWQEVMKQNRELALKARAILCKALGTALMAPESMIGCTACVELPRYDAARAERLAKRASRFHDALQDALVDRWKIQVPAWGVPGGPRTVRVSAQLYNSLEQYEYLAAALVEELERERGI